MFLNVKLQQIWDYVHNIIKRFRELSQSGLSVETGKYNSGVHQQNLFLSGTCEKQTETSAWKINRDHKEPNR